MLLSRENAETTTLPTTICQKKLYAPSGHVAAENTDIDINNGDW